MKRSRRGVQLGVGVALLVFAGGLFAVLALQDPASRQNAGVSSHGQPITTVRTILVASAGPVGVSAPGRPLRAELMSGSLPSTAVMATVLSDENCAPDAQGISHCTNKLRMDGGAEMTVTHPHRMAEVPCLAPGERVSVQRV